MSQDAAPTPPRLVERGVEVNGIHLASAMNEAPRMFLTRVPLVLLPAAGFTWRDYQPVLERFGAERRVFALDWPGFGGSSHPAPDAFTYSAASYADLFSGWLDALGIARAVVLGNGIGAPVAVRYAASHPNRVLGLALIGPVGFSMSGRVGRLTARALARPALLRRALPLVTSLALGPTTPLTEEIAARQRTQRAAPEYAAAVEAYAALARSLPEGATALREQARQITAPSIVVRGAMDPLVTETDAQAAADALGQHGAPTVVLPEAGHLPFLQQPGPFTRAIGGVLNTAEANTAALS